MISNASPSVVPTIQIGHGETFLHINPQGGDRNGLRAQDVRRQQHEPQVRPVRQSDH